MPPKKTYKNAPTFEFKDKTDLANRFARWKQRIQNHKELENLNDTELALLIQQAVDDEGFAIFDSFHLSDDDKKKPKVIFEKFEQSINSMVPNFRAARIDYHFMYQQPSESFYAFYTRCEEKAKECDFDDGERKERFIEQCLVSTPVEDFRKWLLEQAKEVTLDEVVKKGRSLDRIDRSLKFLRDHKSTAGIPTSSSASGGTNVDAMKYQKSKPGSKCYYCGLVHKKGRQNCPAKDAICNVCNIKGHWAKVCLKKKSSESSQHQQPRKKYQYQRGKKVHEFVEESDVEESDEEDITYHSITISAINNDHTRKEVFAKVRVHVPEDSSNKRHHVSMKVDTGAMGNTLPLRIYKAMFPTRVDKDGLPKKGSLQVSKSRLIAYNGSEIPCFGYTKLECMNKGDWSEHRFYIVDVQGPAACGLTMAEALGLVTMHCTINVPAPTSVPTPVSVPTPADESTPKETPTPINDVEDLKKLFPEQFDRIGRFEGEAKLLLKEDAVPCKDRPRKHPIHLKPKIKEVLDDMENQGVIRKVKGHADWHNNLVVVIKKDGSLRLCLDPRKLNKCLRRSPYKIKTLEDISHMFRGAKYFSKMDAKCGYWSVVLDEESVWLTTFPSPFGLYQFLRLPFGLLNAQDLFQERIDPIVEPCEGTVIIADDIAVFGRTEEEHDRNMLNLMKRAKSGGLVFNSKKCVIKKRQIEYYGMIFGQNGMSPDGKKVEDLQAMPSPTSKAEVQEFLGLVTYLGPFINNLSAKSLPLRNLTKKDTEFRWGELEQEVFDHIKTLVCKDACLKYYDTEAPTYLMVDASQKGLGAALLQPDRNADGTFTKDLRPVAFASKSLSPAQQKYANIEREMLAITFGCTRFHTFLYNRPFTVISDHKPLEMICQKAISAAPARLQEMILKIQDYQYVVKYVPGKEIGLADALSRFPNPEDTADIDIDVRISHILFAESKLSEIKQQTSADPVLNQLRETIFVGWPEDQKSLPTDLREYWSYRDELSIEDGMIVKGERILIPETVRESILKNLHTGHLGIVKTQLRARRDVFWPNMNQAIERMCKACEVCQEKQRTQTAEPLLPTEIPSGPWKILGTDLFQIGDRHFLLIADYYSKFPIVAEVSSTSTSLEISNQFRHYIGLFGIPDVVRSDNGPQYIGKAFSELQKECEFEHITSSPRYPKANGFAERQVGIVKPIIEKCMKTGEDYNYGLLRWRTTPLSAKIDSPSSLLLNRKVKDSLPSLIHNKDSNRDEIRHELQQRSDSQKAYHDRAVKQLPELIPGQHVTVQNQQTGSWSPAKVVGKYGNHPRSYNIETPTGNILRRNRVHLRERSQPADDDDRPNLVVPPCMLHHPPTPPPQYRTPPVPSPEAVEPPKPPDPVVQKSKSQEPPSVTTRSGRRSKPSLKIRENYANQE